MQLNNHSCLGTRPYCPHPQAALRYRAQKKPTAMTESKQITTKRIPLCAVITQLRVTLGQFMAQLCNHPTFWGSRAAEVGLCSRWALAPEAYQWASL